MSHSSDSGRDPSRIRSIETRYAGCRFRSRLEARWAVFFDALDIQWEYEPQGYMVGDQPYLPDFRLPQLGVWVEVKGHERQLDKALLRRFVEGHHRLIVLGPVPAPASDGEWCWNLLDYSPTESPDLFVDGEYAWSTPPGLQALEQPVSFSAWQTKGRLWMHYPDISAAWEPSEWTVPYLDRDYLPATSAAYAAARSARFEHGETP